MRSCGCADACRNATAIIATKQTIVLIFHSSGAEFSSRISEGLHERIAEQIGEIQLQKIGGLSIGATRVASCKKFVKGSGAVKIFGTNFA